MPMSINDHVHGRLLCTAKEAQRGDRESPYYAGIESSVFLNEAAAPMRGRGICHSICE